MTYTDEQIFERLPPALQGDLKAFGVLETKTTEQLHQFMLEKRKQYHLPPWHAFTLLIQRAAFAAGEPHQMSSCNSWYMISSHWRTGDDVYVLDAQNEPPWCYVDVHTKTPGGDSGDCHLVIQPKTGRIWKLETESLCTKRIVAWPLSNKRQASMTTIKLVKYAKAILQKKKDHGSIEHMLMARKSLEEEQEPIEPSRSDIMPKSLQLEPVIQTPEISESQREIIRTLLDMAAVKARELNMHTTIVRWRHALEDIIGKESVNAES